MSRYEVVRQDVNCGPVRKMYVPTIAQADAAFDAAIGQGAIYAEVYDMHNESQVRVEFPRAVWA